MVWITILSDFLVLDNSNSHHVLMTTAQLPFVVGIHRMYFLYFLAFFHFPFEKSTIRRKTSSLILQLTHFQLVNLLARFEPYIKHLRN